MLPVDAVVAEKFEANAPSRVVDVDHVGGDDMILDIGPRSIEQVGLGAGALQDAGLERPVRRLRDGTVRQRHRRSGGSRGGTDAAGKLVSVAGGGDTVAALNVAGVVDRLTYVSTAGGAFLEWLEGKPLPGVEVLRVKMTAKQSSRAHRSILVMRCRPGIERIENVKVPDLRRIASRSAASGTRAWRGR